jgi:hypothetical protein
MDEMHFERQFSRLKGQWPSAYGAERKGRIYAMFANVENGIFTAIVDLAIDRMRQAPLADDLCRLENDAKRMAAERRASDGMKQAGLGDVLDRAAKNTRLADPQFVKGCIAHLDRYISKRITKAQFDQGCEEINSVARKIETQLRVLSPQDRAAGEREE